MSLFFTFGRLRSSVAGHLWTLGPFLRSTVAPRRPAPSRPWATTLKDDAVGTVRLSGFFAEAEGNKRLLLVVHGLGGHADSGYVTPATHAAQAAGLACLRLNLRGADRNGDDFYHAGLTADIDAALASPELEAAREIFILGYSLGGHLALRYATGAPDPRVRAVAAVCSPLELDTSATSIDSPQLYFYRRYVLRGMLEMYESMALRRRVPLPVAAARRIRSMREWDHRVVAPRHGFDSAEHYYAEVSVAPRLGALKIPALVVQAEHDPMVLAETVRPALTPVLPKLEVQWVKDGGHVGFPSDLRLGDGPARGLEAGILAWLTRHCPARPSAD